MPRIKEISSQTNPTGPITGPAFDSEKGSIARGLAKFGAGVSELGDTLKQNEERKDISEMQKEIQKRNADDSILLDTEFKSGTLETEKFMDKRRERFQELKDRASTNAGRAFLDEQGAKLDAHFLTSATQYQSELARSRAISNDADTFNNISNSTFNDPTAYAVNKDQYFKGIDAQVGPQGIPFDAAEKLKTQRKEELAQRALDGWININPEFAKKQIESGKWDAEIGGETKSKYINKVDIAIKAKKGDQEESLKLAEKAKKARSDVFKKQVMSNLHDGNTAGILKTIVSNPDIDADEAKVWYNFAQDWMRGKWERNPALETDLLMRINAPYGDPKKITDTKQLLKEVGPKKLDPAGYNFLVDQLVSPNTPEAAAHKESRQTLLNSAAEKIMGPAGIRDPIGKEQYGRYVQALAIKEAEYRSQGKDVSLLYDLNDTPDSFSGQISTYQRTFKQKMRSKVNQFRAGPISPEKAAKPEEDAKAYLKRMESEKAQKESVKK